MQENLSTKRHMSFSLKVQPLSPSHSILLQWNLLSLACNPSLFARLTQSKCSKYIKTLREVNIAFLPYERQVRDSSRFASNVKLSFPGFYTGFAGYVLLNVRSGSIRSRTSSTPGCSCRTNRDIMCNTWRVSDSAIPSVGKRLLFFVSCLTRHFLLFQGR